MGAYRTVDSSRQERRRQAANGHARGHERRHGHPEHRLPMALYSKGLSAAQHTLHDYFTWWNCDGTLDRIHHALYVECRDKAEREASPTACIIDSQSVKIGS